MPFLCPPASLIHFILESLAFSGQYGLYLVDLWELVARKLQQPNVEDYQKQMIWEWLYFEDETKKSEHLYIMRNNGEMVSQVPHGYDKFLREEGAEEQLRIMPSTETQWQYLTGISDSKRLKDQLGDYPFQLLCEIAKYGHQGVHAPDLCKATGQDPRSLTLRLKKLESLGFILKKNVYNENTSQHTSLCIHQKFSQDEVEVSPSDFSEDFDRSRNVHKLKLCVMQSLKNAPNHLRAFKDLKAELGLDKGKSSSKFFRGIVEYLDKHGYAEKVMVKDPNLTQLVFCVKYVKDFPKDVDDISTIVDILEDRDNSQTQGEIDEDENKLENGTLPQFSLFFPLANQLHAVVEQSRSCGCTSMELVRSLTGSSDYRPISKYSDTLTTYVNENGKPKRSKPYDDPYENCSIIRSYDFRGKFKFYRYFSTRYYEGDIPQEHKKEATKNPKIEELSLGDLNKKYYQPLNKVSQGSLINTKKRKIPDKGKSTAKRLKPLDNDGTKQSRGRPKRNRNGGADSFEDVKPNISPPPSASESILSYKENTVDTGLKKDQKAFDGALISKDRVPDTKRKHAKATISSGSLKGNRRREELLNMISDFGGVTYTSASLCRQLDERLGSSTTTDKKTLARDVSFLINAGGLEVQDINFVQSGQRVSRKLLILTSTDKRPLEARINEAKKDCIEDKGIRPNFQANRRVIEGEVTLFSNDKDVAAFDRKKKAHGRLQSLSGRPSRREKRKAEKKIKEEKPMDFSEDRLSIDAKSQSEPLYSLPVNVPKRKKKSKKMKEELPPGRNLGRSSRAPRKFDKSDITTLYRAVIIYRTFKRGTIDFEKIASLFGNVNSNEARLKWIQVRKLLGGMSAVHKGIRAFEEIVLKGVEVGMVSAQDLETVDLRFLLDLWRDCDSSELEISDSFPLFAYKKDNLEEYIFSENEVPHPGLFEQLEANSMRQKGSILSDVTFFCQEQEKIERDTLDEEKTLLKAIFATPEAGSEGRNVRNVLRHYDDEKVQKASFALIKSKELSHHSTDDNDSSFVLTDHFYNTFSQKAINKGFLHEATFLRDSLTSVAMASKVLLLSSGISNGQMAPVLYYVSRGVADLLRIDKHYEFSGYESRLIDKEKLACDIVVKFDSKSEQEFRIAQAPIPIGKICSHIWLDINGRINTVMWHNIIITILHYVVFRPGIPEQILFNKMKTALGVSDFVCVMKWLQDTGAVRIGGYNDYWVNKEWFTILG